MTATIEFLQARIEALDREVRKYRKDREIIMSALARQIQTRNHMGEGFEAAKDFAKIVLNHEVIYHENELIKYEWNYESVPVQDDEHQREAIR